MGMHKQPDSVSGKIRSFKYKNPKATAAEIAKAVGCKIERVYNVLHRMREASRKAKVKHYQKKKAQLRAVPSPAGFNGTSASDLVNSPAHYTTGGIETIKFIEAKLTPEEFRGYLKGNVLKYGSRLGHKGDVNTDAGKLAWYSSRLHKLLEKA